MVESKLDEYEKWVESELEKGNFVSVKDFKEWKKTLEEAAFRTLRNLERTRFRFTVEAPSPELREEAIKLLKAHFGKDLKVVSS